MKWTYHWVITCAHPIFTTPLERNEPFKVKNRTENWTHFWLIPNLIYLTNISLWRFTGNLYLFLKHIRMHSRLIVGVSSKFLPQLLINMPNKIINIMTGFLWSCNSLYEDSFSVLKMETVPLWDRLFVFQTTTIRIFTWLNFTNGEVLFFLNSTWKMIDLPEDTCQTGIIMNLFCASNWVASLKELSVGVLMLVHS